ncbi:hypothetical protein SKAU_G00193740 [Synaphobranchus kaupii]|uniref:Uncharacterized protein n=1 Tax=Synaphobranchus kaupii TaxID=118154 RepID=A0A9Q1FE24_SYNKA|nr:hypothetical protein SKAU_G00193740 [Synaphobranchus kaupii]
MVALLRGLLTSQQRQEEGFLEEIHGLRASILQAPQLAVHGVPQPPNLTSTTMTAEPPRIALPTPTPRRRTAVSAVTQLTSTLQGMSAPTVPAAHQESSHTPLPAERVFHKEPKMPAYQMGEDIENYLLWFERVARTWAWPEQQPLLVPLLTRKVLEAYMAMDEERSNHYDDLKEALLYFRKPTTPSGESSTEAYHHLKDSTGAGFIQSSDPRRRSYLNACRGSQQRLYSPPRDTRDAKDSRDKGVISTLFQRIAMDIVRTLEKSSTGNQYILVICDYATRFLEAFPL